LNDTTKENPMSSPARFTAVQKQALKDSLFIASGDLNHALQPMVHQLLSFDDGSRASTEIDAALHEELRALQVKLDKYL
jgi:hypothetical protein